MSVRYTFNDVLNVPIIHEYTFCFFSIILLLKSPTSLFLFKIFHPPPLPFPPLPGEHRMSLIHTHLHIHRKSTCEQYAPIHLLLMSSFSAYLRRKSTYEMWSTRLPALRATRRLAMAGSDPSTRNSFVVIAASRYTRIAYTLHRKKEMRSKRPAKCAVRFSKLAELHCVCRWWRHRADHPSARPTTTRMSAATAPITTTMGLGVIFSQFTHLVLLPTS